MKAIAKETGTYTVTQSNKYITNEITYSFIKGDVFEVVSINDEYVKISRGQVTIYGPIKRLEKSFELVEHVDKPTLADRIREALKKAYDA